MHLANLASLLAVTYGLQTYAHGDHDEPSPNGGSLRPRGGPLFPRSFNNRCQRPQADVDLVNREFANAGKIAAYAQQNLDSPSASTYTNAFIPKSLLDAGVIGQLKDSYGNAANMPATSPPNDYRLQITCNNTQDYCGSAYYAHMNDVTHTMNLCDAWFEIAGTPMAGQKDAQDLVATDDILAGCTGDSPKFANLPDIWFGRAQSLLHEWTHTSYFTGTRRTIDYAYGVQRCLNLAAGTYKIGAERVNKRKGPRKSISDHSSAYMLDVRWHLAQILEPFT